MPTSQKWLIPLSALLAVSACSDAARNAANTTAPTVALTAADTNTRSLLQGPLTRHTGVNGLRVAAAGVHATLQSSPAVTAFDNRDLFNARNVQQTEDLSAYVGFADYVANPLALKGVTYETGRNIIIGADIGFPITSPVVCYDNFTPMRGSVGGENEHYSLFGFDLTLLTLNGVVAPVTITLTTNLGTYTYPNVNASAAPDATFLGFATEAAGEYFTGFTVSSGRADNAACLKNVSVGSAHPLDATAPEIVPTITGTRGLNDWYTGDVALSWAVTDAESPISSATGCDRLAITGNQAETTYTCSATSLGGTATRSVSIKVDRTTPTVSGAVTSGTLGANGWYTSNVGVTWTIGAAGPSGLVQSDGCAKNTLVTNSASYTFHCTVTSGAGIASATAAVTAKRDATPPMVTWSGNAGTYTLADRVNITCTATDDMSGVASTNCANVAGDAFSFPAGLNSWSASAVDRAGNQGATVRTSFTVTVDAAGLCTLVQRWTDGAGVASSLCGKLTNHDYDSFRSEVGAQSGKKISADHAATLIRLSSAM